MALTILSPSLRPQLSPSCSFRQVLLSRSSTESARVSNALFPARRRSFPTHYYDMSLVSDLPELLVVVVFAVYLYSLSLSSCV